MSGSNAFDVFGCRLAGSVLIEASAGTGKTWNLCALYLRLLLECELTVQQLLVVTFTKAATAELRERIRSRIVETLAFLRGDAGEGRDRQAPDPFVSTLVQTLREDHGVADDAMALRLDLALQSFDEAAIFTIHGFCQRALADTPFAAQMPFALEAVQDDADFLAQAANDFWRRRIAGEELGPSLAAYLVARKDSPARFTRLLARHLSKPLAHVRWPQAMGSPGAVDVAALCAAHATVRALWQARRDEIVQTVLDALPALNGNSYKPASIEAAASGWDSLLADDDALAALAQAPEKIDLLGSQRLKPKKGHIGPEHAFFAAAQALLDLREASAQTLALERLALLRELLAEGGRALRDAKRQRRVVGYDDMLFNLHERLTGGGAPWLAGSLRARYPAALIDEFQDTDPLQFAIFDAIYGRSDSPRFLVGDPKQAIYSFRNADLPTYLQARRQASARYTLLDNQRASAPLIEALNGLFGANSQAFMLPGLAYREVGLGAKRRTAFVDRTEPRAPLQVWTLPDEALLPKRQARAAAIAATAAEIARLVDAGRAGDITLGERELRAGDIAVLVRSHAQGSEVRGALAALGVGSVELSLASVYASPDAEELERVLASVLEPTREALLKAALATELMGLDAAAIGALGTDETQLQQRVQRFAAYRETWLERGAGVMLRELMHAESVTERMLARADGERRLTNLTHLAECLHQAGREHPSPDALRRWLQARRRDGRSDEAAQLRLESDQNLVQIVTIHKAKGLEYALVFCPLLWDGRASGFPDGLDGVEYHDDTGQGVIDFRADFAKEFDSADVRARRRLDGAGEDLRLIYVALTRAMHRCVLVAGCYESSAFGKPSDSESTHSLLNWLVAGNGLSPAAWWSGKHEVATIAAAWKSLAGTVGPALGLSPLPGAPGRPVIASRALPDALAALAPPHHIPSAWWIGSYSALIHQASHEAAAADHDLRVDPPGSAPSAALEDDDFLRFPRGVAAGECVHAVFERVDFTEPSRWPGHVAAVLAAQGTPADSVTLQSRRLLRLLHDVIATALPVGPALPLVLASVPRDRRLTEVEFHLPASRLAADRLNETLAAVGIAVPRLAFGTLEGYLKGFIDLVVEHDGRYFIVDWKSNHLGDAPADYGAAPIAAAMASHGYHLQSLLYSVALDRLLQRRLPGYDAARHFGGALYLFVRGLRPGWTQPDGTPAGLHFHRPTSGTLRRLSAWFERPSS